MITHYRAFIDKAGFGNYRFGLAVPNPDYMLPPEMFFPKEGVAYDWPTKENADQALVYLRADRLSPEEANSRHLAVTLEWRRQPST